MDVIVYVETNFLMSVAMGREVIEAFGHRVTAEPGS
jgi:hypothetical protein